MDSFYSTIDTFLHLKNRNIFACGILSKQRLSLSAIQKDIDKLKEDSALCYTHGDLKLFVWKTWKHKIFYLLSTIHDGSIRKNSRRYDRELKQFVEISKPEAIEE